MPHANCCAYNGNKFILGIKGRPSILVGSSSTWKEVEVPFEIEDIKYGNKWLAVGTGGILASEDGYTWKLVLGMPNLGSLTWNGCQWLAVSAAGQMASEDGITWSPLAAAAANPLNANGYIWTANGWLHYGHTYNSQFAVEATVGEIVGCQTNVFMTGEGTPISIPPLASYQYPIITLASISYRAEIIPRVFDGGGKLVAETINIIPCLDQETLIKENALYVDGNVEITGALHPIGGIRGSYLSGRGWQLPELETGLYKIMAHRSDDASCYLVGSIYCYEVDGIMYVRPHKEFGTGEMECSVVSSEADGAAIVQLKEKGEWVWSIQRLAS
jgi:hypothetical protein